MDAERSKITPINWDIEVAQSPELTREGLELHNRRGGSEICRRSASSRLRYASYYGRPSWVVQPALNGSIQSSMPGREDT